MCRSRDRHWDPCLLASRVPSFQDALRFHKITYKVKEEVMAPKPHSLPTPSTALPLPDTQHMQEPRKISPRATSQGVGGPPGFAFLVLCDTPLPGRPPFLASVYLP